MKQNQTHNAGSFPYNYGWMDFIAISETGEKSVQRTRDQINIGWIQGNQW